MTLGRILVIDDDDAVRGLTCRILAKAGYGVQEAADGAAGLASYHQQRCDLVITDIMMPEKDGLETIRELRRLDPKVRIIAMSGGGGPGGGYLELAAMLGAAGTLQKPFTKGSLLTAVDHVLATNRPT